MASIFVFVLCKIVIYNQFILINMYWIFFHPSIQIKNKNVLKSIYYSLVTINLLDRHNTVILVPRPWSVTLRRRCNNEPEGLQSWPQVFFLPHIKSVKSNPRRTDIVFLQDHILTIYWISNKRKQWNQLSTVK